MCDFKINVGVDPSEIYFSENEEFLNYLRKLYPNITFHSTLVLSEFHGKTCHTLPVSTPVIGEYNPYDTRVHDSIVSGVIEFLDKVSEEMYRMGIRHSTAHMSRINFGSKINPIALKPILYANLNAYFSKE